MSQTFEYLLIKSDQNLSKQSVCYILSRQWYNQYLKYINPDQNQDSSYEINVQKPSETPNSDLIIQEPQKYVFNLPKNDYLNIYVNPTLIKQAKILDKDTWEYIKKEYPQAITIQRPIFTYQKRTIQNLELLRPNIIIFDIEQIQKTINGLSDLQLKHQNNIFNIKKCQLPSYLSIEELKNLFSEELNQKDVRIWKLNNNYQEDYMFQLCKSIKQNKNQIKGKNLDAYRSFLAKDLIKNAYTILIEIQKQQQLQEIETNLTSKEKMSCENCQKIGNNFTIMCYCKAVFYCSQTCKYIDQDFHSKTCQLAAESESDEEMNAIPLEIKGICGLRNIGNTCFMAACLQNLYFSIDFSSKFTFNTIVENSKDCLKNKLVQKFVKLLKEISIEKTKIQEIWSFKTQFSYIFTQYQGNYQHDAAEFLLNLLDALNTSLGKEEEQQNIKLKDQIWENAVMRQYNIVIKQTFLGLYKSLIQCNQCDSFSQIYEPFLMVQLPIKTKPVKKQIYINIIFKDIYKQNCSKLINYTSEKTQLKEIIDQISQEYEFTNSIFTVFQEDNLLQHFYGEKMNISFAEIEQIIQQKNNCQLALYECEFPNEFLEEKEIKILYFSLSKMTKIRSSFMQFEQKESFSVPRVFIFNQTENLSFLYIQIFEIFRQLYEEQAENLKGFYLPISNFQQQNEAENQQNQNESKTNNQEGNQSIKQINQNPQNNQIQNEQQQEQKGKEQQQEQKGKEQQQEQKGKQQEIKQTKEQQNPNNKEAKVQQNNNQKKEQNVKKEEQINEELEYQLKKVFPFQINIKSKKQRNIKGQSVCAFCQKENCQNCLFPFLNQKSFEKFQSEKTKQIELELFWNSQNTPPKEIKDIKLIDARMSCNEAKKQIVPTIQYCLEEYTKTEQLNENNMWFCSKCEKMQNAFKTLSFQNAPNNLVLHLKRFNNKEKNNQQVLYDHILDFSTFCSNISPCVESFNQNQIVYELYGVILHEGNVDSGHYIAMCKYENQWYQFNDDEIQKINNSDKVLNNKNAYILFYCLKK